MRALGPVILLDSLTAEQIGAPPAYFNARYLLSAAAESPIPATHTLGGFTQGFVERAVAEMRWRDDSAEIVRFISRAPEERDLPRLRFLRIALQGGGMLRKYRGAFHPTVRGRALLAAGREGELYLALCEAFFGYSALGAANDAAAPLLRYGLPLLLWLLLQSVGETTTVGDLVAHMRLAGIVPPGVAGVQGSRLTVNAVRQRLIEPLEELGLVDLTPVSSRPPERSAQGKAETAIRVTALFERFVIPAARLN